MPFTKIILLIQDNAEVIRAQRTHTKQIGLVKMGSNTGSKRLHKAVLPTHNMINQKWKVITKEEYGIKIDLNNFNRTRYDKSTLWGNISLKGWMVMEIRNPRETYQYSVRKRIPFLDNDGTSMLLEESDDTHCVWVQKEIIKVW